MKKVWLGIGILLLIQGGGLAATATQEAEVKVEVESIFTIAIDQGYVDFERMKPGEVKWNIPYSSLITTCKSNRDNPWYLKISSTSDLTSGDQVIPLTHFYWYGWTEGRGSWYGEKGNRLTTSPMLAYAASPAEYSNYPDGTRNAFKFKLTVPGDAKPGIYSTLVKFTLTE